MNQISSALAQAGVKLPPLTQRVWQVLHDQKVPRTGKVLASMLNLPQSEVASALSKLHSRGMVAIARHERTRCTGPKGTASHRLVAQYAALGNEYELLPVLPTTKAEPAKPVVVVHSTPATIDIGKMTLSEAHALYKRLQEFFS